MTALFKSLLLALCCAFVALPSPASAEYVTTELVTNEYTELEDILPELLRRTRVGWNKVIKESQDTITFTQATNLNKYCDVDYTVAAGTQISGLLVLVQFIETQSRSLATTEICAFSKQGDTYFPRIGLITMDVSKSREWVMQVLDNVMEHEVGHLLGLGILWERYGLVQNGAYIGSGGLYGYERVGASIGVESVPTQRSLSSNTHHWDDNVLGGELMTGRMNGKFHPLSAVTLNALTDIGYQVHLNEADDLSLIEDGPGNLTYSIWIDLFHDYQPIATGQKVPVFADGTLAYKSVKFTDSDGESSSSTSSSESSSGSGDHYHYIVSGPSTWEIVATVLLVVAMLALFATCGFCLYNRRMQKFANSPTEPMKYADGSYPTATDARDTHQHDGALGAV
mmetsp:Transcript_15830/g.25697  ORF Transcript_15830/g.25697 Transcript_15830/m.25697 type:complete len:397 (+) Transcript_15830:78-1268(+)